MSQGSRSSVPLEATDCIEPIGQPTGSILLDQGRQIRFPDRLTQRAFKRLRYQRSMWRRMDDLRDSWPWVLLVFLMMGAAVLLLFVWGIPAVARHVADQLPPELARELGKQGLENLRSAQLSDSRLEPHERSAITQDFLEILQRNELDPEAYVLHFHRSEAMGANAFALPSGDLVLLDGLWEIGMEHEEILGVLAHEIAHVQHNHGLQMLLRYAGVTTLLAITLGDLQSTSALLLGIPTLLIEKGYSREFEREADSTAVLLLARAGLSPMVLAQALERLERESPGFSVPTWLASHPDVPQRIANIRQTAERLLQPSG